MIDLLRVLDPRAHLGEQLLNFGHAHIRRVALGLHRRRLNARNFAGGDARVQRLHLDVLALGAGQKHLFAPMPDRMRRNRRRARAQHEIGGAVAPMLAFDTLLLVLCAPGGGLAVPLRPQIGRRPLPLQTRRRRRLLRRRPLDRGDGALFAGDDPLVRGDDLAGGGCGAFTLGALGRRDRARSLQLGALGGAQLLPALHQRLRPPDQIAPCRTRSCRSRT